MSTSLALSASFEPTSTASTEAHASEMPTSSSLSMPSMLMIKSKSYHSGAGGGVVVAGTAIKRQHYNRSPPNAEGLKRVSFGGSKGSFVETLIYDSTTGSPVETNGVNVELFNKRRRSDPSPRPNKFRVHLVEGQAPAPIAPPGDTAAPTLSAGSSAQNLDHNRHRAVPSTSTSIDFCGASPAHVMMVEKHPSETDSERDVNPFRPNGQLSHEVDPIVQSFKRRPFPISPVGTPSKDLPDAAETRVAFSSSTQEIAEKSSKKRSKKDKDHRPTVANGDGPGSPKEDGIVGAPRISHPQPMYSEVQRKYIVPQHGGEIVHIEADTGLGSAKKRRCCTIL